MVRKARRAPPPSRNRASSPARLYRWLALLPTLGMLGGVPLANRAQPYMLGLPPLLAWIVGWVLLTSAFMGVIFALDRRRDSNES